MRTFLRSCLLICSVLLFFSHQGIAQQSQDYSKATVLFSRQKYEQAYKLFHKIHTEHPKTFLFLQKAAECLINMKEYDRAISIIKKAEQKNYYPTEAAILLGKIYHTAGDTQQAEKIWNYVRENNPENLHILLTLARTMSDRREFEKAIAVYQKARKLSPASTIITSEIAGVYLQAGEFKKAVEEYLSLIKKDPGRITYVQQQLISFRDNKMYEVAISEISDFLDTLPHDNSSYIRLQQFQVWLLMESGRHAEALKTARKYESESSGITYVLFNLGQKFLAEKKFRLAEQAYSFYIDHGLSPANQRAMQLLSQTYKKWAEYLYDHNLSLSRKYVSLNQKALATLKKLKNDYPNYNKMNEVLVSLSELSLDVQYNSGQAQKYLNELPESSDKSRRSQQYYLRGRIYLFNGNYSRARFAFTKSIDNEKTGVQAEKNRYFLALTDFFAGDYDFAKIQLKTLERQTTSYFVNDALRLQLWIQNGILADSSSTLLDAFARAVESFHHGKNAKGVEQLKSFLKMKASNALTEEALLQLSSHANKNDALFVYKIISSYLDSRPNRSALYERLMWERARLADQFVTDDQLAMELPDKQAYSLANDEHFFQNTARQVPAVTTAKELISLYEKILLRFPNGFYAPYVRNRIEVLQNKTT